MRIKRGLSVTTQITGWKNRSTNHLMEKREKEGVCGCLAHVSMDISWTPYRENDNSLLTVSAIKSLRLIGSSNNLIISLRLWY
jgi:hypothetical protein